MIPLKHNPMMLPRVNDLFKLRTPDQLPERPLSNLEGIFDVATNNISPITGHFFSHIYMPLELYDSSTQKKLKTWADIGLTLYDLSEAYWSQYSRAFLDAPYYLCNDSTEKATQMLELGRKAKSVLNKNKYKYLKLIESIGLEYNPLFNVDGVEIRQRLANEGFNDVNTSTTNNSGTKEYNATADSDNVKTTHNVSAYDTAAKEEYNDTTKGQENGSIQEGSVGFTDGTDTFIPKWENGPAGGTNVPNNSKYVRDSRNRFTGESNNSKTEYSHNNAKNMIDNGDAIGIFIEGTRSKTGELLRPKSGAVLLAYQMDCSIIPVSVTYRTKKKHAFKSRKCA
jgi:hypothetical protein